MKSVVIFTIAFVLLISLGGSNLIQQSYTQSTDLEGIELELLEWKKIESDKSDVLILTISFINNGRYASDIIPNYVYLVDSQERTFGPSDYYDLQEKGFPVTGVDCPLEFHTSSNPGLSSEEILCYEVPKGIGDSFSLDLWSNLPSLCEYMDCTIISLSVTIPQLSESNNSFQIPSWIKNNAKWWSNNQIDDTTFVSGIKFLITEKILTVPQTTQGTSTTEIIPSWIKNTVGFWADDQIGNTEFLSAMQFLIKKGILNIPQEQTQIVPPSLEILTVTTNKSNYNNGEVIEISGQVPIIIGNTPVTIQLFSAESLIAIEQTTVSSFDGSYTQTFLPDILWEQGNITVSVSYGEGNVAETEFSFTTNTALTFDSPDCSGNARCFTGTVTRVTDGDTLDVNGQAIRFALASAPETNEYNGPEATKLIETLCPVGSTATVDEDDKQTQGSYGRIVGVIYCNGMNLNEELIESGLGYLSSGFCNNSEFSSSSWANCPVDYTAQDTGNCDPSYPDFCIPPPPPDLDCGDIPQKRFTVLQPDPHRFDGDKDGIGCES